MLISQPFGQGVVVGHLGNRLRVTTAFAFAITASLAPEAAHAQAAPPGNDPSNVRQPEVLQRRQQEQINEDQVKILTSPRRQTVIDVPTHEKAVAEPGACRVIGRIEFERAPLMNENTRRKITEPYVGRCLGLGDVENLLSDITRFYIKKGRPTTRVYIKPQSLSLGVLVLDTVEGRIEKVIVDDSAKSSLNLFTAFGYTHDTAFNLRVYEQGLDQINRLASNNASLDILPGSRPGYSVVRISNKTRSRFHISASADNSGQSATGRRQATGSVIVDNIMGLNDLISYSRRQAVFADQPNTDSQSNSVLLSIPLNALTFTGGYNHSTYRSQTVAASGTVFVLSGNARTAFGKIDMVAWRNSTSRIELSAQLTSKRNRNFLDNNFLAVNSRTLTILDMQGSVSTIIGNGSLKLGGGLAVGLDGLGALDDTKVARTADTPRAQYQKITGRAYLAMPFTVAKQRLTWTGELEGQYALDPLFGSEQIVIGSPFTVRGFLDESLATDHGFYLQQEVSTFVSVAAGRIRAAIRPHVGVDIGYGASVAPSGVKGWVGGVSAGVGLSAGPLNMDVSAGRSVARGPLRDEGFVAIFRATLSI